MSQESVRKIIPFTEKDLEANRRFEITDVQLNRLRSDIQNIFKWSAVGLIVSTILLIVLAATGQFAALLPRNIKNPDSPSLIVGFIALIGVMFAASLIVNLWCRIQSKNYEEKRRVLVTEGKIERVCDEYITMIRVGDIEFHLDETAYEAFTDDYYRVYYLDTADILSVETPEK